MTDYNLIITKAAAKRIQEIVKSKTPNTFLRLEIVAGGCHGFESRFSLDETLQSDDITFTENNASVVCDTTSLEKINGSTIEYSNNLMGSRFWLNVKTAKGNCSCGSSFSV